MLRRPSSGDHQIENMCTDGRFEVEGYSRTPERLESRKKVHNYFHAGGWLSDYNQKKSTIERRPKC